MTKQTTIVVIGTLRVNSISLAAEVPGYKGAVSKIGHDKRAVSNKFSIFSKKSA